MKKFLTACILGMCMMGAKAHAQSPTIVASATFLQYQSAFTGVTLYTTPTGQAHYYRLSVMTQAQVAGHTLKVQIGWYDDEGVNHVGSCIQMTGLSASCERNMRVGENYPVYYTVNSQGNFDRAYDFEIVLEQVQ